MIYMVLHECCLLPVHAGVPPVPPANIPPFDGSSDAYYAQLQVSSYTAMSALWTFWSKGEFQRQQTWQLTDLAAQAVQVAVRVGVLVVGPALSPNCKWQACFPSPYHRRTCRWVSMKL